ncbi:YajQ family cyclic di-GMP-binding protein [Beggiatoa leptomitoformis]|uniref:Nucleotide-binding protein BLE401_07605 n=1 Tax=Beggiatoa leptomitoformis TaxID=288004 RepID=A0A2N9YDY4_9GAMM|nr:YajQ family cyclic di-GMP-binding protein [Beggiatoa leptomitoformis]ALG69015.1 YajQ family cyclic di-GMP-binding protein [Beggiatoa leptomitoformis]AUI68585.1 YajQ family cyclic di-GMP-binding protein [Beggiatoa leptomitoformis]
MPSFDIVSTVDMHELSNAVDQTNREIVARFDFKGSDANIEQTDESLILHAETEFQLQQIADILHIKLAKRGIDLAALDPKEAEIQNRRARQTWLIKQGIPSELAKKIVKLIKDKKIKVQAAIQGDEVRVTGKKRDDLQEAISLLKSQNLEQPLQFTNFRD